MALNRARAPKGMTAWARGKPYKGGQFLPSGVVHYTVEYWYNPTAMESLAGAVGRQQVLAVVGVGMSTDDVQEEIDRLRSERLAQRLWRSTPTLESQLGEVVEVEDEDEDLPFPPQPGFDLFDEGDEDEE